MALTTALIFLQYRFDNKYQYSEPYGKNGVLDLRGTKQTDFLSILTYGWEFYSQELIEPGSFDGREPFFTYLGEYGGFEAGQHGQRPEGSPHGCATYRLKLLLPQKPGEYALELPEIFSASRVFVNGSLVNSLGNVADLLGEPAIRTGMVTFQASKQAEIVVQASDSHHYYSGMVYPPAFGTVAAVSDLISFRLLRTCIMVISSLTIGFLYLLIGIRTGKDGKEMSLFASVSLLFAFHVMYPLFHLFGAGYWTYYLEDVSFCLFLAQAVLLHCSLCGIRGRARRFVMAVTYTAAGLSLIVPALLLRHSLDAMLSYSAFLGVYKLALFGWLITTAALNKEQGKIMNSLLLTGLCVLAASILAQQAAPVFEPVRFGWPVENAGFLFILLLAGGLWYGTVSAYAERAALSENIRLMKRQFSLQEENYRIISDNFEQTRRMRHDLRHHLNTMSELIRQKQYEELHSYIEGYQSSTEQSAWPVLCENHAANAVLNYYQQLAVQKNVPLNLKVALPSALKLEGWSLGVLFGNLLENAIEASEKLPCEMRMVSVYSKISKGNLLISVKNHWNGEYSAEGDLIHSTKRRGFGIGVSSVRNLVEEHGGQFYLTPSDRVFEVSIVLWNQVISEEPDNSLP